MNKSKIALLLIICTFATGIVRRHDLAEDRYLLNGAGPAYLIDLPHEGHGVLIAKQWIVTVAHTIFYDYHGKALEIQGTSHSIEKVVIHPGYAAIPDHLLKGDSQPLMDFFLSRHDIALIKLATPVQNAAPIAVYTGKDEQGRVVRIFGKGATGTGTTGEEAETKEQKRLRHCENRISQAKDQWLSYVFDEPDQALPLEGMHGAGDSGGPSVLMVEDVPYLAGLSSWQSWRGDLAAFKGGLYGTKAYQVRISTYSSWIEETMQNQ